MATTGAVAARATAGQEQDDHQHDDDADDPEHLHPAWRAGGRFAI
jgi:hypothetical protein